MAETHPEGSPWFWKIFGGTILGMVALLLLTLFGNIRNENSDNKQELLLQINELRVDLRQHRESFGTFKERFIALEQGSSKEKLQTLEQSLAVLTETISSQKEKVTFLETGITSNKDELKIIREEIKDLTKQIQEVREKVAALTPALALPKKESPITDKP